jgi:hypothetical protein
VGPETAFYNLVAEARHPADTQVLVVGAHYDTVPVSPGADDNASGVAALLELARSIPKHPHVRLIAFTNEEAPLGRTQHRGSSVAAAFSAASPERLLGMIAIESVGYFSDRAGSQRWPTALGWLLPDRANFVLFVGNLHSRRFLHDTMSLFRATSAIPTEGLAVPDRLIGHVRRSDHAPYWDRGFPAVMVTGTAQFRNANYHKASDVAVTIDFDRLAEVTVGLASAVGCMLNDM